MLSASCAAPRPDKASDVVNINATSAAYPWLEGVYACAPASVAVKLAGADSADVRLRLGEPENLTSPAFQIGTVDVLVVVQPQTAIASLTIDEARAIFSGATTNWKDVGGADVPVQVWAYAPGEDLQAYFDEAVMNGRPITSLARLAASAQEMSDSVGSAPGSVGLLDRRWKAGNTRDVLTLSPVPVLAIVRSEPTGAVKDLLSCLQSSNTAQP